MCPHCNAAIGSGNASSLAPVLFGLALAGCGDSKDDDGTNTNDSFDSQAAYGVPDTDFTLSDTEPTTDQTSEGSSTSDASSSSSGDTSGGSESSESSGSDSSGSDTTAADTTTSGG